MGGVAEKKREQRVLQDLQARQLTGGFTLLDAQGSERLAEQMADAPLQLLPLGMLDRPQTMPEQ